MVKVSSRGFESVAYPIDRAPFDHPLGLIFATATYFRAQGIHIDIDSSSPPRSALGGSSSAAVALSVALTRALGRTGAHPISKKQTALLAHAIEGSVAGVPCGLQDQLAAVYGGVNAWYWPRNFGDPPFEKKAVVGQESFDDLQKHLLVAYCGIPHESKNINNMWVRQFLSGEHYDHWADITASTHKFVEALVNLNYKDACASMNRETAIRREITPGVLDAVGEKLVYSALENNCGARFTGAGGGGCVWALGDVEDIDKLKGIWEKNLSTREGACLLDVQIDAKGVLCSI
jgi:D-glycero-alpha-D-manno-heptose-7-phosphate kinase